MIDRKISIRYARALSEICNDKNLNHREVLNILNSFNIATKENPDLHEYLKMSIIPIQSKLHIIDELFSDNSSEVGLYAKNSIEYVVKRNRFLLLEEIVEIFEELVNKRENILKASVTSAVELDEITKDELREHLEKEFNKKIELSFSVNKELIAGIVIQIDDVVYDGSASTYLNNLERKLLRLPL